MSWTGKQSHCLTLQPDCKPIIRETEITLVPEQGQKKNEITLSESENFSYISIPITRSVVQQEKANILNAYLPAI